MSLVCESWLEDMSGMRHVRLYTALHTSIPHRLLSRHHGMARSVYSRSCLFFSRKTWLFWYLYDAGLRRGPALPQALPWRMRRLRRKPCHTPPLKERIQFVFVNCEKLLLLFCASKADESTMLKEESTTTLTQFLITGLITK